MLPTEGGRSPSRPRFRFALGLLCKLIALCAVAFAALRSPIAVVLLISVAPVLPGFILGRVRGGTGISGGMLSGALTFVGCGIACYIYALLFDRPRGVLGGDALTGFFFLLVMGSIWGIFAGIILHLILQFLSLLWRKRLTDDSCAVEAREDGSRLEDLSGEDA
jgi:hypothetical protein